MRPLYDPVDEKTRPRENKIISVVPEVSIKVQYKSCAFLMPAFLFGKVVMPIESVVNIA